MSYTVRMMQAIVVGAEAAALDPEKTIWTSKDPSLGVLARDLQARSDEARAGTSAHEVRLGRIRDPKSIVGWSFTLVAYRDSRGVRRFAGSGVGVLEDAGRVLAPVVLNLPVDAVERIWLALDACERERDQAERAKTEPPTPGGEA